MSLQKQLEYNKGLFMYRVRNNETPEYIINYLTCTHTPSRIVQELCESRGGRPGLSVPTSLLVSVDVKNY